MRQEVIVFLLAIIFISTLSTYLSNKEPVIPDNILLDTSVGSIGSGNFSYWECGFYGSLIIKLVSLTGDADLYVADNMRPSYEVDRNNFSSTTCGTDYIYIPGNFPRPIGIGVFGAHRLPSSYQLQIWLDTALQDQVLAAFFWDEQILGVHLSWTDDGEPSTQSTIPEQPKYSKKDDQHSDKPRILLGLLHILDAIFEMFLM